LLPSSRFGLGTSQGLHNAHYPLGASEGLNVELKVLMEHALCRVTTDLMAEASAAGTPLMSYSCHGSSIHCMRRLLDMSLWLSNNAVTEPGVIYTLLEQVMEGSTLSNCKDVFRWVEEHTEVLNKEVLMKRGKLIMLRTCNELLRRLSKANDTAFCGRILVRPPSPLFGCHQLGNPQATLLSNSTLSY
jgi:hypothetical protein